MKCQHSWNEKGEKRMASFLRLENVSFAYPNGHQALEQVSIAIEKGERVAIIGQNGAGKTTAAKLMNGLYRPTEGDVWIDGWNTKEYTTAQIARKVGYVFQNPDDQIFHNRVYDEIAFGPKNLDHTVEEIKQRVQEAARIVQIDELLEENPYDLPFSVRRFVTAASVIAMNPDVVILDEPTAGQDKKGLEILGRAIDQLTEQGKTVITITHDMEFVAQHFHRTIVMAHRKKIADGSTQEIFYQRQILEEAGVKPPHISRLSQSLGFDERILGIDDFIHHLKKIQQG